MVTRTRLNVCTMSSSWYTLQPLSFKGCWFTPHHVLRSLEWFIRTRTDVERNNTGWSQHTAPNNRQRWETPRKAATLITRFRNEIQTCDLTTGRNSERDVRLAITCRTRSAVTCHSHWCNWDRSELCTPVNSFVRHVRIRSRGESWLCRAELS